MVIKKLTKIKIEMSRKQNFIDKLPNDKKSHLVLGLLINPVIFILCIVFFGNLNLIGLENLDIINRTRIATFICVLIHFIIEADQKINKKGRAEFFDWLAGFYSAFILQIICELMFYLLYL